MAKVGAKGRGRGLGQRGSLTWAFPPTRGIEPTPQCSACNHPNLSLHKPALEDLLLGSNASITCTLSGLKSPNGSKFSWSPSGGKEAVQKPPERDQCGCYSVSSVLPGCAEPWNRGETFFCTANHPELKSPKTVNITKNPGGPRHCP